MAGGCEAKRHLKRHLKRHKRAAGGGGGGRYSDSSSPKGCFFGLSEPTPITDTVICRYGGMWWRV